MDHPQEKWEWAVAVVTWGYKLGKILCDPKFLFVMLEELHSRL